MCFCILYPGTKICIASATRTQANEILNKIVDDFMKNYSWGSDNLKREIEYSHVSQSLGVIEFYNGSWIKVVTTSDAARGNRANIICLDEFRLIDKTTIDTVIKRFLGNPRHPLYLDLKEYKNRKDLLETNKEMYLSSAWYQSHWSYDKAKSFMVNFLIGKKYFICWLPYQLAILEGLKNREEIEDEMSEMDFDATTFDIEMGCIPLSDTDGAFFKFDNITETRKLKNAIYPPDLLDKTSKVPDLALNERRILSVDVALMASTKHKNDASAIMINSAIPKNDNTYSANIIYMESHEGMKAEDLALIVRRLFDKYKCTDLVLDTGGQGLPIYDLICSDMLDYETGEVYPALSCCNDKDMEARCTVEGAAKVVWSIKASAAFNSQAAIMLRNGFLNHNINLLVSEIEAENILKSKIKNYTKLSAVEQARYKMPYVQTSLLIYELIYLECEMVGTNVKIKEKSGKRKDRYSCLMYNYFIQCQIERDTLKRKQTGFNAKSFAEQLQKFNHKPITY